MRRYLLGRDTADGLKQSVLGREQMEGQKEPTLYPMPIVRSKLGVAAERARLEEAEERLAAVEKENISLRKELEDQRKVAETGYAEAYEIIQQVRQERPPEPKRVKATVGFDKPETWWQWTKRVILRMP